MQPPPEQILEQTARLRGLARALVGDASTADDIVQSAWLRALRSGPRSPTSWIAWLSRVVRNLSLNEVRDGRRRHERERAAARSESDPPADETIARIESQREVLAVLRGLPEPYRRTLIERFLEERSIEAIARGENVTAATIRWRSSHAVGLMRAELDRRHGGDRRAWGAPLLGVASRTLPPTEPTTTITIAEILLMKLTTHATVLAGICILTVAGFYFLRGDDADAPAIETGTPVVAAGATPTPDSSNARRDSAATQAERRVPVPVKIDAPTADVPESLSILTARFLDASSRPLPGAELAIEAFNLRAISGADGTVAIDLDRRTGKPVARATARGFASHWIEVELTADGPTELGDIVLERGATIAGRVLTGEGEPVPNATVTVTSLMSLGSDRYASLHGPWVHPGAPEVKSGPDGRFEVQGVAAGGRRVWARATDTRYARSQPLDVQGDARIEGITLHLEPSEAADWIAGRVVDPDGEAVPSARLSLDYRDPLWSWNRNVDVDSQGRFKTAVAGDAPHSLRATDPRSRWPEAVVIGVEPGTHDVELRFGRAQTIRLVVHTPDAEPPSEITLYSQRSPSRTSIGAPRKSLVKPGEFEVEIPTEPFVLSVIVPGYRSAITEPIDPAAAPDRIDVTLVRGSAIAGLVVSGDTPVAGARVRLCRPVEPDRLFEFNSYEARVRPSSGLETTTDETGRFSLAPTENGQFVLLAQAAGHATAEVSPVHFSIAASRSDLVVELSTGGSIAGTVRMPEGQRPEGVIVSVNRGDTFVMACRVGTDGAFRFDHLAPGPWQVRRTSRLTPRGYTYGIVDHPGYTFVGDCEVREGEVTPFELDLSDARGCVVTGGLTWGGRPASGWTVTLMPRTGVIQDGRPPSATLDSAGRFTLENASPGRYRLSFVDPQTHGRLHYPIDLERGPRDVAVDIPTGTLEVVGVASRTEPHMVMADGDAWRFSCELAHESAQIVRVPAGALRVGHFRQKPEAGGGDWHVDHEVFVGSGERMTVDLE